MQIYFDVILTLIPSRSYMSLQEFPAGITIISPEHHWAEKNPQQKNHSHIYVKSLVLAYIWGNSCEILISFVDF